MNDLESVWHSYQSGDYEGSLLASLTNLVNSSGIDYIHIAGLSLMNMRRHEEGLALLKAAVAVRPESPHICINAAYAAEQAGLLNEVHYFTTYGLADFPDNIDLLLLKANNFVVQMRFDEAEHIYHEILQREPSHVQSLINLGNIFRAKDDFASAEAMFVQASELEPEFRDLVFARATMFTQRGEHKKAMAILEPIAHDVDAQFLLSLLYLADGDYLRGFRLYRSRANSVWYKTGNYTHPLKPFDHYTEASDKNIAVLQEGGLGDSLQFCRYVPMLATVTRSLTYFVPPTLERLMRYNMPLCFEIKTSYDKAMDFDYITTDVEMPYHFRTTIDTIPDKIPYLSVPEWLVRHRQLPATDKKRVGLCWAGGARDQLNQRSYDERRSLDLAQLAPLAEIDGIEFVSLQYGARSNDTGMELIRVIDQSFDFMDTGAIISQLDAVISVDTSVVHLAAAMGKPTCVLSRYDCCWRWTHNRRDSVWYPGVVKVFGQERYRDWSRPLADLKETLAEWRL